MLRKRNQRAVIDIDQGTYHRKKHKQLVLSDILPNWLVVEQSVFKVPSLFGADVSLALHWDDMSFDQFMDAGFISTYPEARQYRIEHMKATPLQQFGFDGAVLRGDVWSGVQVKHHRKPVSPESLGSFLMAHNFIKANRPGFHSFLVSTSGFTERVTACGKVSNYDCVSLSASKLLNMIPAIEPVQPKTDIDYMTALRPCQQEALDAMQRVFEEEGGHFILGLPPGAGKTLVCMLFCLSSVGTKYKTIIVASPLRSQVSQTKNRFDALLKHCKVDYTSTLVDIDGDTTVGSVCAGRVEGAVHYIHTTFRSAEKVAAALLDVDDESLVIIDEAHRYTEPQVGCLNELSSDIILVSGTWSSIPSSLLCNVEEESRYTMTITDAEKAGIIVPQRFVIPAFEDSTVDISALGLEVRAEFIATSTMRLNNGPRRHILYSATVSDAKTLATLTVKEFERSGMRAEARVLTGDTPAKERDSILKWVGAGTRSEVRIISSVHVLDEGIDIPPVDCVFISSIGSGDCRYVQRVCRSVRLYPGKTQATVLVWSSSEGMKDLSEVFRERTDWQSSVMCMGVSLETSNREMEKAVVEKVVMEIEKGIVGWREWSWDRQFKAWVQASQKGPVTQKQVEILDAELYNVGYWQDKQRCNRGGLTADRVQQLDQAGFVWGARTKPKNYTWEDNFRVWLQAAKKGPVTHKQVETLNGEQYNVGSWQGTQRTNKNKMSSERVQQLDQAGFVWSARTKPKKYTWEDNFRVWLQAAKKGPVTSKQVETLNGEQYNIGAWQDTQRTRKSKISSERVQQLDQVDFVWSVRKTSEHGRHRRH